MRLFGRKKSERPKSPLGLALYQYDNILERDLKKILKSMNAKKRINPGRAGIIINNAMVRFDNILEDLSKDNLKVDYRSDKIRYRIIEMINKLKDVLKKAGASDFDPSRMEEADNISGIDEVKKIRNNIKSKMKDIESDYL